MAISQHDCRRLSQGLPRGTAPRRLSRRGKKEAVRIPYSPDGKWDRRFEAFVARIAADFIDNYDPVRERCRIAGREGEPLGCVFLVKHREQADSAQPRMLLATPASRGGELGERSGFGMHPVCASGGYRRIVLWTNAILTAAPRLCEHEGYRLTEEKPHQSFGQKLAGQMWEWEL